MSTEKWKKVAEEAELEEAELAEINEGGIAGAEPPESELMVDEDHTLGAEDLRAQISKEEARANEYLDKMLRLQADVENQRRRMDRELASAHKYALDKFIDALLPVIDSLERGMQAKATVDGSAAQAMHEGMELTHKMFLDVLKKFGVLPVDPVGEPFNPNHHEAVSAQPSAEHAANTVMAVLQKGYLLNDRLVRPALVVVAK